ncbi:MAG: S-methyl-5'-thioinosine phosphorylase [Lysobacterales bacterium]|jgi:5'-methylthioinosine phosphorylase
MKSLGLIGGTGLDRWGEAVRHHAVESEYGVPSAEVAEFDTGRVRLYFLPRHGVQHQFPPHAVHYRANVDALRQLEVDGIIAVNAVGGIGAGMGPGRLVVPDQLIDYTWGRAHSYSMGESDALRHVEFGEPFSSRLRRGLVLAAVRAGLDVHDGGCVGVTQGPRLETAAEVSRLARDGCDLVGMTTMPEAALAREAGLDYASLCVSANWAAGVGDGPVSLQEIDAVLDVAMKTVRQLLRQFFKVYEDVC